MDFLQFIMPVPLYRFRVMFVDGHVIDVIAPGDSSDMRKFAIQCHGPDAVVAGAVCVGQEEIGVFTRKARVPDVDNKAPTFPPAVARD